MLFTLLLAPIGALAVTTTTSIVDFDPMSINDTPPPAFTQPPVGALSQSIPYNSDSVSSEGSAAVTSDATPVSVATSLATVSIPSSLVVALSDTNVPTLPTVIATLPTIVAKRVAKPLNRFTRRDSKPESSSISTALEEPAEVGELAKRGNCAVQPDGWASSLPLVDDVVNFMAFPTYHIAALKAATPAGYTQTFNNLNASVSANSYLGLQTLRSYDTLGCSKWCDNTTLCTGFNIFHERDPSLDPGPDCTNPPTIVNYKCTLWGSGVDPAAANNFGQWREQYQVVISGSNGYEKTNTTQPPTPKGCLKPQRCTGGALHAVNALLDTKFFSGAFDINLCAAYANAQNAYNKKLSKNWFLATNKCKMFNAYMVKRDGVPLGTYCGLYSQYFAPTAATYQPGRLGKYYWGIESSHNVIVESGWLW